MIFTDYYADPERYQAEYGAFTVDRDWYCQRAQTQDGPVLELGCGTGRILLAVAQAGLRVTGIDRSAAMLDQARTQAISLDRAVAERIQFVQADFTTFSLGSRFGFIMAPLNALMHLHTDRDLSACLRRVKDHLLPHGRFVFDLTVPHAHLIAETDVPGGVPVRHLRIRGQTYLQRERHQYDSKSGISRVRYSFLPCDKDARTFHSELALRMYPPDRVVQTLAENGLKVLACYGDFNGNQRDEDSVMQLYEVVKS